MTEQEKKLERPVDKGVFHAPWEKSFDKILTRLRSLFIVRPPVACC